MLLIIVFGFMKILLFVNVKMYFLEVVKFFVNESMGILVVLDKVFIWLKIKFDWIGDFFLLFIFKYIVFGLIFLVVNVLFRCFLILCKFKEFGFCWVWEMIVFFRWMIWIIFFGEGWIKFWMMFMIVVC